MKWNPNPGRKSIVAAACAVGVWLMTPEMARGQSAGRVACPRSQGYVYLYSDMTTLEVRTTLQCGEQVDITGRYDKFFGVRTSKGDTGYLPLDALLLIKDKVGPNAPQPSASTAERPRMAYDPAPPPPPPPPPVDTSKLTLPNGVPVQLKLAKAVSTATAHEGDVVEFEVLEDVVVEGLCVIRKGAPGAGKVTDSDQKKRMKHGAKLGMLVNSVQLSDNETVPVRSYQESTGPVGLPGGALPYAFGKDIVFPAGMQFQAFIDGEKQVKREAFQPAKGSNSGPKSEENPSQPPQP